MLIRYLSYGISKTGGYRHEKCLFDTTVSYYTKSTEVKGELLRKNTLFKSIPAYLNLLFWSYLKSEGDINIVTARTAIPALMRNRSTNRQVWIVLHNYDENDGKSKLLDWYYRYLFKLLRQVKHKRYKVIVVAPYWEQYFKQTLKLPSVHLFSNYFDVDYYQTYKTSHKNAWVHLGQYSTKNDPAILTLAGRLIQEGYYCYFSTLNPDEATSNNGRFEILYFDDFKDYLEHLSRSCCTLALSSVKEGWNRIAHESILLGTPVIGYNNGGLGDLLRESNSIIVKDIDEAYTCIIESLWVLPESNFTKKYDLSQAELNLKKICMD